MQRSDALNKTQALVYVFKDDGAIPNNPKLPLLFYPNALRLGTGDPAVLFERLFAANQWRGAWRNGIYTFHHYHSTAHEVLGIAQGTAKVQFGGEEGAIVDVGSGDAVVIPAGVGHKNLGASPDLLVVGAYPSGQGVDLCRGAPGERPQVLENIARVPLPPADPLYGSSGPLVEHWGSAINSKI